VKWLVRAVRIVTITIVGAIAAGLLFIVLAVPGFFAVAWVGEKTGWYRVEDSMCTSDQGCAEYIAEKKRLQETR
jgi:hypothetical protein